MERSCSSSCSLAFAPAGRSYSSTLQSEPSSQPEPQSSQLSRGKRGRGSSIPALVPDQDNGSGTDHNAAAAMRKYRGIRMRKWGKWVAEIREPNKRSRIWLGSYSTPVAAARAYDTAVFFLRGRSARLNFPEEIGKEPEAAGVLAGAGGGLSAASIRQKAAEVGARVDALHAGGGVGVEGGEHKAPRQQQHHHNRVKKEEEEDDDEQQHIRAAEQVAAGRAVSTSTTFWKKPDLNRQPSPEWSEDEDEHGGGAVVRAC